MPALRLDALMAQLGVPDGDAPASSARPTPPRPGGRAFVPPTLVWLHGDEALLAIEAADALRARARADGFSEREVVTVDRSLRADRLAGQAGGLSLFAECRLLEIRFGSAKPGKELGDAIAAIAESATAAGDGTLRIVVTSGRLDRATQETAWWQRVDRAGATVPVPAVERAQLPGWIAGRLALQGQRADDALIATIADRVEGNLLAAHQEIRKLGLLCPPGPLDADTVRAALSDVARYDAFDVVDAMLAGDAPRALRAIDGLRAEGTAAPLAIWALADASRTLARLADARDDGRPLGPAMRALRVFGSRERLYENALRRLDARTPRSIVAASGATSGAAAAAAASLLECARADRIAKGLDDGDPWQALLAVAMRVAGAPTFGDAPH